MKLSQKQQTEIQREVFNRSAIVEREYIDVEKRTVEIAFSSEEPYGRWFGTEILSHDKNDVDMSFMSSGNAPFLSGHDHDEQVGVIEKAWIDPDLKGRAIVRFGKSDRASEVFNDIADGIRKNISVGYMINKMTLVESDEEKGDTYRVAWKPFEASSVSVPADTTVGVGRSNENNKIEVKKMSDKPKVDTGDLDKVRKDARREELNRIGEISALGKAHGLQKEADEAIESEKTVDQFRQYALDVLAKRSEEKQKIQTDNQELGMSKKEVKSYSIMNLVRALADGDWSKAEFEKECWDEFEKKSGRTAKGAFIPPDILNKGIFQPMARDLSTGIGTAGGYLVAEELQPQSFIELLRNSTSVIKLGARVLTDLQGDIDIPKQTGGATAYWVNEGGTLTESQQTLGQIRMTPKTVGCYTDFTRRMMIQSSLDVENFIRSDFAAQIAIAIDLAALNGSGAAGQPRGILQTTGIGSVTLTTANTPTWGEIVDLESEIATDNALMGSLGYVTNATISGNMKQTDKASGAAQFILEDGSTNGYPLEVSNNVPAKHIIFGNWADLIIGMWSGLDVTVDKTTLGTSGGTRIIAFQDLDVAIRHAESFADGYKA